MEHSLTGIERRKSEKTRERNPYRADQRNWADIYLLTTMEKKEDLNRDCAHFSLGNTRRGKRAEQEA